MAELALKNRTVYVSKEVLEIGLERPVSAVPNGLSNTEDCHFGRSMWPVAPTPVAEVTIQGSIQLPEECAFTYPVFNGAAFHNPALYEDSLGCIGKAAVDQALLHRFEEFQRT